MGSTEKQIGQPEVCLRGFGVAFGNRILMHDVDAAFGKGRLTALLGRNGTGKSTLLKAIAGLGQHSGTVTVGGYDTAGMSPHQLALRLAFVGTGRVRIPAMRCRDIVAMGRAPHTGWTGRLSDADKEKVEESLEGTGTTALADRFADTLSDGEFQRVMIARALAQDTPVILLDEPTSFLDLPNRYNLCTLLAGLAHTQNKCVIFSTHELDIALALADDIALIDNPKLIAEPTAEMIAHNHISRLFNADGAVPPELWSGWVRASR